MSTDPILAYHRIHERGKHFYELSGVRTRSIRDQILRGEMIVDQLCSAGVLNTSADLLVVGGGAAGVSCALAACARGIRTVLVEIKREPFFRQRAVATRWLDPAEYDWPQPHWRSEKIGGTHPFPLAFEAASATDLANRWESSYLDVIHGRLVLPGALEPHMNLDARSLAYSADLRTDLITVKGLPGPSEQTFGAAISCIGFAGEKTSIPSVLGHNSPLMISQGNLKGPEFWSDDWLDEQDLGLRNPPRDRIRCLVSGGGDGAQQDFQRMLTGMFGKKLYDALNLPTDPRLIPGIENALLAEDAALRAFSVATSGTQLTEALKRWYHAFADLAQNASSTFWRRERDIDEACALLKPNVDVTWLLGGPYPGYSYGLNRLLCLLLTILHSKNTQRRMTGSLTHVNAGMSPILTAGLTANYVVADPPHGICCGGEDDNDCYGHPHKVIAKSDSSHTVELGPFDVIVVRHGVSDLTLFGSPPVREQRLPFYWPE